MSTYIYKETVITANSKQEAIGHIIYSYKNKHDKKLLDKSSQMIKKHKKTFYRPDAKMYENYKGAINKDTLIQAWKDGWQARRAIVFEKENNLDSKLKNDLSKFEKYVLPYYMDLVNGKTLKVYRGVRVKPKNIEYSLRNLLKENSWSFDKDVAIAYAKYLYWHNIWIRFVMIRECTLNDTNIMLSAFNEGYWCGYGSNALGGANDEIILNKSFNIGKVKIYPIYEKSKQQLIELGYSSKLVDFL